MRLTKTLVNLLAIFAVTVVAVPIAALLTVLVVLNVSGDCMRRCVKR